MTFTQTLKDSKLGFRIKKYRQERKDLVYNKYGKDAEYGHFFLHEINRLKEKHAQFEEVTCTGKAGTVIFADTRGIHKGTPLKSGKRVLLAGYFDC